MIRLRAIEATDEARFLAAVEHSRSLHRPWVYPPATGTAFQKFVARLNGSTDFSFAVEDSSSGAWAGVVNLSNIVRGNFCSGYLGYFAFAGFQGRGWMKAGLLLAVQFAFRELRLHRLEANIQPGNETSIRFVEACGFHREGFSPRYLKIGGRWRDHERWAIIKGFRPVSSES